MGGIYNQDAADISAELLRGTQGLSLADIVSEATVDFAGGQGYLIEARLDDLTIVQYVHVSSNGRHIRLLASAEHSRFNDVREAVDAIAHSVTLQD